MIRVISAKEASNVIDTRKPTGQFLVLNKHMYTGIDNKTGNAWTEDFKNLNNCLMFLSGESLEDCLELDGDNLYNKKTCETIGEISIATDEQIRDLFR